jgi:MarR family transcriptional regulator, organic hydroperoxide resistance regulator
MKTSESRYSSCVYFSSSALARKVEKIAVQSWKPVGLSPSHGYLLMNVIDEPGIQPGSLADQLQLQPSTITRLIEKLEEKKLVIRTTEGKLTNVYPTPKAKELQAGLKKCVHEFHKTCTGFFGKDGMRKFASILNKMADKVEE